MSGNAKRVLRMNDYTRITKAIRCPRCLGDGIFEYGPSASVPAVTCEKCDGDGLNPFASLLVVNQQTGWYMARQGESSETPGETKTVKADKGDWFPYPP